MGTSSKAVVEGADELGELRQQLADQQELLVEMQNELKLLRENQPASLRPSSGITAAAPDAAPEMRTSRRGLVKAAGAATAGLALAAVAKPATAAAADPNDLVKDAITTVSTGATEVRLISTVAGGNIFTANSSVFSPTDSGSPAALAGWAGRNGITNGIYGYTDERETATGTGHALVVTSTGSARSQILFAGGLGDPRTSGAAHRSGEMIRDLDGKLWWCVDTGTPGTWRKVSGPDTAGSFHAITPKRVWDTRFQGGPMSNGQSRKISIKDGRALSSSSVDVPDLVPVGATAITFNLAVVGTSAGGFLAVTPGDAAQFTAASINWHTANSVLNNGTISTVNSSREVTVWCTGSTDFIIDVTGYYL